MKVIKAYIKNFLEEDLKKIENKKRNYEEDLSFEYITRTLENFSNIENLDDLDENEQQDMITEIADNNVDIYTSDLLEWVSKNNNYRYIEDACDEFGCPEKEKCDFLQLIRQGQYFFNEKIIYNYIDELKQRIDNFRYM